MSSPPTLITPQLPDWMAKACKKAGPDALEWADWFLYAGLALGIAAAVAEAIAAFRGRTAAAPALNRTALTGVQAIIAALTSLLQALKDVRTWLALVIVGLVLLVIGASAPDLCVPEHYRPQVLQQQSRGGGSASPGQTGGQSGGAAGQGAGGTQSPPRTSG